MTAEEILECYPESLQFLFSDNRLLKKAMEVCRIVLDNRRKTDELCTLMPHKTDQLVTERIETETNLMKELESIWKLD